MAARPLWSAHGRLLTLTEGADLMLYDPALEGHDTSGQACTLAIDSGLAHPDVPLVLDADDASYPQAMRRG